MNGYKLFTDTPEIYEKIAKIKQKEKWQQDQILFTSKQFYVIKDRKWKDKNKNNLHLLAIPHREDILSMRDLRKKHLPLLKNIRKHGLDFIKKKYKIPEEELFIYLHYYPSIWHLHIHFVNIKKHDNEIDELIVGRAFLLDHITDNLIRDGNYYKNAKIRLLVNKKRMLK